MGQRHIGDFTRWQEHDAYRQALERLLRDLEGEASPREHPSRSIPDAEPAVRNRITSDNNHGACQRGFPPLSANRTNN
jgi:hypothetical protein